MQSTRMRPWCAGSGIVVLALAVLAGVISFRDVVFAAQIQAPSVQGAAGSAYPLCPLGGPFPPPLSPLDARPWCVYRIVAGDRLGTIARHYGTTPETLLRLNRKRRVSGRRPLANKHALTPGALLLIPAPSVSPPLQTAEAPGTSVPPPAEEHQAPISLTPEPPLSTDESIIPTPGDSNGAQTSLQATPGEQATRLAELSGRAEQYGQQVSQIGDDLAVLKRGIEELRIALAALRHDVEKRQAQWPIVHTVLLVMGAFTLVTIGALLAAVVLSHSSHNAPAVETTAQTLAPAPTPPMPRQESAPMDIQSATCSLSSPKGEDVILRAGGQHFSALVLADGASSLRRAGSELSGGGGQAAQIAAKTAITYLTRNLLPAMGIEEMLPLLEDCFRGVRTALEEYNAPAPTPGATTLLIGLLCQAGDGRWYWLYGHVGNGVCALLHTKELLSSWPVTTGLLSKHTNGVITVTLPGDEAQGFFPSVGVRPYRPGDLLVIGSDGLDHLDTLTKHTDRLTLLNYVWKIVQDERSSLERALKGLGNGRQDGQWQKALALDDTTIGMLWG